MTNRRPPSSMPPFRGDSGQSSLLLEGLTLLAKMAGQALEQGTTEISRSVQVPLSGGRDRAEGGPGVLDASLRVRTCSEAAGSERTRASTEAGETMAASRMREPLVDLFDEDDEIVVAAEVPGCGLEDVDITVEDGGRELTLTARGIRGYRRRLPLPAAVDPDRMEKSCNNGMLNVRLGKSDLDKTAPESDTAT
ncbi:Hsp20/alpha crystallin family protein [Algihabitans albus]|uniref:Hsp20/alpha crystallin family protein n=1 Tax=Algihabitans albus TaxID=2164067 RepID=UPI0035D0FE6C